MSPTLGAAELADEIGIFPRRFALYRHRDPSGVSGTGVVALGTAYPGGPISVAWRSRWPSVSIWRCIDDLMAVHGHGDATEVIWLDNAQPGGPPAGTPLFTDWLP